MMTDRVTLSANGRILTLRVPFAIKKRGGRKLIVAPDGTLWPTTGPRIDNAMVKALARAFRWRRLLEEGRFTSIAELARSEKISRAYVSTMLRLTLLAPDIVEAILDGRQPRGLQLHQLLKQLPVEWEEQRIMLGFSPGERV